MRIAICNFPRDVHGDVHRSPRIKILKVWVADFRAGTPPRSGGQKKMLQTTKVFQAARPPNPRIKKGLEKETEPGGQKNPCRLKREKTELVPKVKRN